MTPEFIQATSKCPKVCFLVQIQSWNKATPALSGPKGDSTE